MGEKEKDILRQIVEESPLATLEEVTAAFCQRTGLSVHSATVRKGLREAGIKRQRARIVQSDPADEPPPRYGYQTHHRDQKPEPRYPRRVLVDACCYVVRTGCAWRMLPAEFPPWQNVYRTFRRWVRAGKFKIMHDRLRAQWRHPDQGEMFPVIADSKGFVVLPKRWVVERTHGWNERSRRLVMHHDRRIDVSEAWV